MSAVNTIMNTSDIPTRLLGLAALTGVYTFEQGCRFAGRKTTAPKAKAILDLMITTNRLGLVETRLPRIMGGGSVFVVYLCERGKEELLSNHTDLKDLIIQSGAPYGRNFDRIPHELVTTEALLYLSNRHEIIAYQNDKMIRRSLLSSQFNNVLNRENLHIGDFRVCIVCDNKLETLWIECESVVNYTINQIINKPGEMLWFTVSKREAEFLSLYVNGQVILLPMFGKMEISTNISSKNTPIKKRNKLYNERRQSSIINILKQFQNGVTSHVVAAFTGYRVDHTAAILSHLTRQQLLIRFETHLHPGKQKGRPFALFAIQNNNNSNDKMTPYDKINALLQSHLITNILFRGYKVNGFDSLNQVFNITDNMIEGSIICDDLSTPVKQIADKFDLLSTTKPRLIIAISNNIRGQWLRNWDPNVPIIHIISPYEATFPEQLS